MEITSAVRYPERIEVVIRDGDLEHTVELHPSLTDQDAREAAVRYAISQRPPAPEPAAEPELGEPITAIEGEVA